MENCLGGNRRNAKAQQKDLQQLKSQQQLQQPNQNYYTQNPTSTQQKRLPARVEPPPTPPPPTTTTTAKESLTQPNKFVTDCLHFPPPPEYPPTPTAATTPIMPTSSTAAAQSQGSTIVSVAELQQHSHQQRQKQQQKQQKQTLKVQIDKKATGNGTGNDAKPVSLSKNSPTIVGLASSTSAAYERRPPRYPDPDPDAIEICNEHEPTHTKSTERQFKTLGHRTRSDVPHANIKWSREPESVNFQLLQMHQNSTHQQRLHYAAQHQHQHLQQHQHEHDYSYAYYEPGAAIRHANVPAPEGVSSSSSPSTSLTEAQTNSPPPPPNSMRALLSKGRKNKLLSSTSLRHGYQMPYNPTATMGNLTHSHAATSSASTGQTGSGENFYEEISSNESTSPHCLPHTKSNSKSVGALGPSTLIEEELRRVQNRHRKILGELNLSVEAMLMPESPPSLSPTKQSVPSVSVTAASGQPILNSSALALRLSSSSADNICDPYNYDGPADDFISPIQPVDLDSGFSGSSGGASSIGTLRLHKRNVKGSSGETASGFHALTLSSATHCRTLHRANTTTTIPTILTLNERQQKPHECRFLTRASCGRRILNCAKIRAAEDPGPTVPRPESKARSFWNRKGWRKFPGFASTSSIDSTGLTTVQNVFVPQSDSVQGLLLELRNEIKSLRTEVSDLKQEIKDMKVGNVKVITKLTEEVIAVKLENRKHHSHPFITGDLSDMQQLPFAAMADLIKFDEELQNNEDKLMQFKQFIAKTGGEGYTQFLRTAIRKVFSDELASAYSWKGTSSKPSAEKCFIVTTIKNEHKLNSPTGWEESIPPENQLKTTTFIGNTATSGQFHNPILVHRTACNGSKALTTPANNNTNTTTCTSSQNQHQQLVQYQQHRKSCSQTQNDEADHTTALVSHTGNTIAGGSFSTNGNSAAVGVSTATAATAATTTAETETLAAKQYSNDDTSCDCDCQSNSNNSWCTDLQKESNSVGNVTNSSNEDITLITNSISNVDEERSNVTSSLSATNQRNSQLRSTFSRAKQHLSFDKWRSGGGTATNNAGIAASNNPTNSALNSVNGTADSNACGVGNSATLQSNRRASASCTMPTAHQSPREHDQTTPGESSPGGRLSRWFSIRRGSSNQYDIHARGNDVRQSLSSSIDIPDAGALVYGEQHSSPQKLSGGSGGGGCGGGTSTMGYKMPGVPENEDDDPSAYSASSAARFDMDLIIPPGSRANGTARTANERLITPMLPPAPPGLSQQQLKRRHIIAAIVHSENSYVATLQRLVNDYKRPLEESNPPVLSASKIGTLFHRLPEILQSHKLFRISLAECVRNWDRDEKLGDCFVSTFSKPRILEIYSGFINNFSAAMELAKMEEKRKSALADFFKVKQISAHDRLSFFGLMVKPVQRFPQFILFLQDLLKYTPQGHHDRMSLQLALTQLELLAEMLNERKREAEQYQGFKEMLGHISGTFNTRSLTSTDGNRPRYLLREDNVTHMEFNQAGMIVKSKQRRLLLLNDKVICVSVAPKQSHDFGATEKLTFKWMYPVTDVEIVDNTTSATLSRILTAGLNRGGSLKSNSSSCNNYSTNTLPVNVTTAGTMLDTSPAVQLTNGADNLCNEMSTLMYDYEVISRIHDLVGSLKGTYKELNTSTTRNILNNIQGSIQRKNEEMAWVDSCILQLIARNKSGKEETYTFQTLNPSVKKEWITELRLAQLALDTNNSPAWEASTTEPQSTAAFGCYGGEHHQKQLLQPKQSNKMPLFVKAMPVYKSQHQTEVRCGCYYTITNDIKLTGNARRRHKQQNYLWICTSDGTSSHIAVLSQHHQQAGNLRDVGSFDLVETQVTSMEFVRGLDNCKSREDSRDSLLGDLIWMGTDSRKLFIYSAQNPEQEEQLNFCTVPGAIMRILYHFDAVYVALSNAMVLIYRRSYDGTWMLKDPQVVQLGDSGLAVPSLLPINMNIYAACANRVYVLNALNGEVQKSFEVQHGANQQVHLMAHSGIGLWISLKNSTVLCLYHTETFKHLQDINIATSVLRNDSKKEKTVNNSSIYVTALMACKGLLWVGTNVGIAVTIPLPRLEGVPIIGGGISMSCHAHFGPITFLLPLIPKVYPSYKPSASQAPLATLCAEPIQPHTPSMGEDLQLPAIDADPKKLTEADLDESIVILRRDLPKEELSSGNASPSAGTLREANSNTDSNASSPRSSKLEKQNSLDQSFSAKLRASLANSPAFHRKRFRDLSAESARISKTLPRGLGSASFFTASPHSNVSTLSHTDHGYCDVYGLYGKLIFVKEDYDAEEGTQGNLIDMMYEGMRRSDPELAAIPGKVTTLDRRLRMKAARPRSLDLSNWSVDSKSSSLYTSSGSEESMGIRLFGGRSVSRNSSSASHKTSGNGSDLGNISENGLMTTHVEIHQHSTPKSEDGFKLMLADCKPNTKMSISPNAMNSATVATLPVSAAAATLKRKQKQNAKQQQQQQNADGPRTIITLTGGRGYWRHVWYNNSHSPGNKTATLSSGASSPLTANSNDAHIVIWEKKL